MNRVFIIFICALLLAGCGAQSQQAPLRTENLQAKKMLQGIWLNEEDGTVSFKAVGDTIYYPDSTSQAVAFKIFDDTLVLYGAQEMKYPIIRQAAHLFQFKNQIGDVVKLTKSADKQDNALFSNRKTVSLNQKRLIKRDTIIYYDAKKYHCYIQINPTTYKVIDSDYNDDGVMVDNIYYDNIIHLSIFQGPRKVFSRDFHKTDYARYVPKNYLSQGILNDMVLTSIGADGIHYNTEIGIPNSPISYLIENIIHFDGKLKVQVKND